MNKSANLFGPTVWPKQLGQTVGPNSSSWLCKGSRRDSSKLLKNR